VTAETPIAGDERVGGFRFVRMIHPGVTSSVLEVVQDSTGKRFALKVLQESRAHDSSERKAFEFEAKLGMQLRHPNLIHILEYHKTADPPYFVMDLFPSHHLKLHIARPSMYPLPTSQVRRIIIQAARALMYLHDHGWIHRDVKPENILVNKSGEARVIDLALAMKPLSGVRKLFGGKAPRQGTPSYMSPEQIRCESPAPTADIYSFGVTCYELAVGRPPFRANSTSELLHKHLAERPAPLTTHNKGVTAEFNDLVLSMIQKRPADRPASFQDVLTRLARIRVFKDDPPLSAGSGLEG
jgi:serine/threonine protein kinase